MKSDRFEIAIAKIDECNTKDINTENYQDKTYPKELLYAQRMTKCLLEFEPNASEALQIAARAQHICRWKIPRNEFPMDRVGYLKWREKLKIFHADLTSQILKDIGYDDEFIDRVSLLILKKKLKKDKESQVLEDVIFLVFLQYYFEAFSLKHNDEKLIEILKKTWKKMSEKGRTEALKLDYSEKSLVLIKATLA